MSSSTVFKFKLESAPTAQTPVQYGNKEDEYYITVSYGHPSYDKKYPISQIIIYHSLKEGASVPIAPGRGRITSQSLQIPFGQYEVDCKPIPAMKMDDEATLAVTGLTESSEDPTCLRSGTITLTIGTKTYTITPTAFSDNRISKATCSQSGGGKRKRRTLTKRRAIKKKTRRSF